MAVGPHGGREGDIAASTIGIGSGKGGVGKSTVTLNLALLLARRGFRVGVLDADVYGPNIALMLGLKRSEPASGWMLARSPELGGQRIEPVDVHGIRVMSMAFAVSESQPLVWYGGLVRVLVQQLVRDVDWGPLDWLLIDMPPGTGDVQQAVSEVVDLDGVVLVVTPQDVTHLDARRAVEMYRQWGVTVLGAVENMAGLACPHCREHVEVFRRAPEERSLWSLGIEKLGSIPLDPELSNAQDGGQPMALDGSSTASAQALGAVGDRLSELRR